MKNNMNLECWEDGTPCTLKPIEIGELNMSEKKEMVNHPSHYGGKDNPYEAIKVIEAWKADFNIGTTLRYLCRCGKKTIGGTSEEMRLEDLRKAAWYLNREIENIEKEIMENKFQELVADIIPDGVGVKTE